MSAGASRRPDDPSELRSRQEHAERLVRDYYRKLRWSVTRSVDSILRARKLVFKETDYEEWYNSAWFALYEFVLGGETVENPGGWLVNSMKWQAFSEHRKRASRPKAAEHGDGWEDEGVVDRDFAADADDRALIRNWRTGLRTELNATERRVTALRMICGYSRIEIAEILEVDRDKADKIMDAIHTKTQNLLRVLDEGDVCRDRKSLITAYAYGVLDPEGERYAAARQHILECPACAATVRAQRGLCVLLPVPALVGVMTAGGGGGILGLIAGFFKGTGAGTAGAGVGSAGAGATGGLLATGGVVKGVAGLCALCIGGAVYVGVEGAGTTPAKPPASVSAAPRQPAQTLPTGPPLAASAPRSTTSTSSRSKTHPRARSQPAPQQSASTQPSDDFSIEPPPAPATSAPPPTSSAGTGSTASAPAGSAPSTHRDEFSIERTGP